MHEALPMSRNRCAARRTGDSGDCDEPTWRAHRVALRALIHIAQDDARFKAFLDSGPAGGGRAPDARSLTTRLAALDHLSRDSRRMQAFLMTANLDRRSVHESLRTLRREAAGVYCDCTSSADLRRCA